MNSAPYELSFEIIAVTEQVEDAVADHFDALISAHSGVTKVTLSAEGDTCLQAALAADDTLRALGAKPLRLMDDLVSRGEVARRVGVTPQAVGQWIRGERHAGSSFPAPFVLSGGGLWLWGEVVAALADRGVVVDEDVRYPTRRDAQLIGGAIASMQVDDRAGWSRRFSATSRAFTVDARSRSQITVGATRANLALAS